MKTLAKSISTLLAITLLLNNFYVFTMEHRDRRPIERRNRSTQGMENPLEETQETEVSGSFFGNAFRSFTSGVKNFFSRERDSEIPPEVENLDEPAPSEVGDIETDFDETDFDEIEPLEIEDGEYDTQAYQDDQDEAPRRISRFKRCCIGLTVVAILGTLACVGMFGGGIYGIVKAVNHANRCGCSYELCNTNCTTCQVRKICWRVCEKTKVTSRCSYVNKKFRCRPVVSCARYGTRCRYEKAHYQCSYYDNPLGNVAHEDQEDEVCNRVFDLCENDETEAEIERLEPLNGLCSGRTTFSQACKKVRNMNETEASKATRSFRKMTSMCEGLCKRKVSASNSTSSEQCEDELDSFCD